MCHGPGGVRIVSEVTARRLRRGHQFRLNGPLAHQTREDTGHHT